MSWTRPPFAGAAPATDPTRARAIGMAILASARSARMTLRQAPMWTTRAERADSGRTPLVYSTRWKTNATDSECSTAAGRFGHYCAREHRVGEPDVYAVGPAQLVASHETSAGTMGRPSGLTMAEKSHDDDRLRLIDVPLAAN